MPLDEVARASLVLETHIDESILVRSATVAAAKVNRILSAGISTGVGSRGFQNLARVGQQLTTQFGKLAAAAGPPGIAIAAVAAAAIAAAVALPKLSQAIVRQAQLASNLNESLNATNVILGAQAANFLETFEASERFGVSQQELLANTAPVAAILREAGFSSEEFGEQLTLLTQRAIDTSSVFNVEVSQVLQRFGGAIRGETRAVEALGIAFNAFEVEQRAMALGFKRVNGEIEENGKQQARLSLILEQSDKFAGDFEKTQFELANQQRVLRATTQELRTEISEQFLPAAKQITASLIKLAREAGPELIQFFKDIVPVINFTADVISAAAASLDTFIAAVDKAKGILAFLGNVFLENTGVFGRFLKIALDSGDALNRFDFGGIVDKFKGTASIIEGVKDEFIGLAALNDELTDLADANNAITSAARKLDSANQSLAASTKKLRDLEAERVVLLNDTARDLREIVEAEEKLTRVRFTLRDLGQEEIEIQEKLKELRTPATADELAEADRGIERAKLALNQALREEQALLEELNEDQKVSVDLTGLTLDQLRTKLNGVRASLALQRANNKAGKTEQTLEEKQLEARLNVGDAQQALNESLAERTTLEDRVKSNAIEIREAEERLVELSLDRAGALRDESDAQKELNTLRSGDTERTRELKVLEEQIAGAKQAQASAAAGVRDAENDVTAAKLKQQELLVTARGFEAEINALLLVRLATMKLLTKEQALAAATNLVATLPGFSLAPGVSGPTSSPASALQIAQEIADALLNNPNALRTILARFGITNFASGGVVEGVQGRFGKLIRAGEYGRSEMILPLSNQSRVFELLSKNLPKYPGALRAAQAAITPAPVSVSRPTPRGFSGIMNNRDMPMTEETGQKILAALEKNGKSQITVEAPITVASPVSDPNLLARKIEQRIVSRLQ